MSDIGMIMARMGQIVQAISDARAKLRNMETNCTHMVKTMDAYWHGDANDAYMARWDKAVQAYQETITTLTQLQAMIERAIEDLKMTDAKGAAIAGR